MPFTFLVVSILAILFFAAFAITIQLKEFFHDQVFAVIAEYIRIKKAFFAAFTQIAKEEIAQ